MDDEDSKNSFSDDYEEDENYEEDDENTLEEEEALPKDDNELDELQAESEMSIEELRRKYYGEMAAESTSAQVTSSTRTSSSRRNRGGAAIESIKDDVVVEYADSTEPGPSIRDEYHSELTYFTEDMLRDDEPDEEYKPPEWWKKVIRVGKMYQAHIVSMLADKEPDEDDHADPLWKPMAQLTEEKLERYLLDCYSEEKRAAILANQSQEPARPRVIPDNEDALYVLFKENYNLRKAQRLMPFELANNPRLSYKGPWRGFVEDEVNLFEEGLRTFGKKFDSIKTNFLPMRSVGELVQFYYSWKKTERHDMFIKTVTANKEDPSATDFMESLADQFDSNNQAVTSSTSASAPYHAHSSSPMVSSTTSEMVKCQIANGSIRVTHIMGNQIESVNKN